MPSLSPTQSNIITKQETNTSNTTISTITTENYTETSNRTGDTTPTNNSSLHTTSSSNLTIATTFNAVATSSDEDNSGNVSTTFLATLTTEGETMTNLFTSPPVVSSSYETTEDTSSPTNNKTTILTEGSSIMSSSSALISTIMTSSRTALLSENTPETHSSNTVVSSHQTTNEYESTEISDTSRATVPTVTNSVEKNNTTPESTGGSEPHSFSSTYSITTITATQTSSSAPQTMTSIENNGTSVSKKISTIVHSSMQELVRTTEMDTTETDITGISTHTLSSSTHSVLSTTPLHTTTRPLSFTPNIDNAVFTIHFDISLKECVNESAADEIELHIKKNLTENIIELVSVKLLRLKCSVHSKRNRRSSPSGEAEAFTVTTGFRKSAKGNESQIAGTIGKTVGKTYEINVTEIESKLEKEFNNPCGSDVCKHGVLNNKGYECKATENGTKCLIQSVCLYEEAYCKYGAHCEIRVVGNSYQPGCRCEDTLFFAFTGLHCEKKSLKLDVSLYTAGVIGALIIITFVVIILLMRRSWLKKSVQKEPLMLESPDGHEELTNIQSFDNQSYDRDYETNWDIEKSAHTYDYIDTKLSEVNYSMQIKRPKLVSTYY
ncbi:mucin-2-like [Saccostrea echinata]|uniref:mucin-2-like n=1 Tax=Saccostrea echinata TaxID=191078 RepID=UPI002A80F2D5|nr:mucin-2-like [Saccostrea echinata]XP_061165283.1 mucin-2-like [Saccostrea echinata]